MNYSVCLMDTKHYIVTKTISIDDSSLLSLNPFFNEKERQSTLMTTPPVTTGNT